MDLRYYPHWLEPWAPDQLANAVPPLLEADQEVLELVHSGTRRPGPGTGGRSTHHVLAHQVSRC